MGSASALNSRYGRNTEETRIAESKSVIQTTKIFVSCVNLCGHFRKFSGVECARREIRSDGFAACSGHLIAAGLRHFLHQTVGSQYLDQASGFCYFLFVNQAGFLPEQQSAQIAVAEVQERELATSFIIWFRPNAGLASLRG
jgi:hypothetical protein